MMMVTMRSLRFHRALHVLDQGFEGVLRGGGIVRFERALECGEIIAKRAVIAEKLAQRILSRVALQIVLKGRQGALGRCQIARLNGAANAFEVVEKMNETVRGGGLIGIRHRTNT